MVPDPATSSLGLEYFCFEGDGVLAMADRDLIELGKREVALRLAWPERMRSPMAPGADEKSLSGVHSA
jgi:hypothetical protein